jgi:hypothetical protein
MLQMNYNRRQFISLAGVALSAPAIPSIFCGSLT